MRVRRAGDGRHCVWCGRETAWVSWHGWCWRCQTEPARRRALPDPADACLAHGAFG